MPSSRLRDDLPSHMRAGILSKLADAVIWGVGHARRSSGWLRATRVADRQAAEPLIVDAVVVEERPGKQASKTQPPKALPRSPHRSTAEAFVRADEVRERLLRKDSQRQEPTSERRPF